MALRLCTLPLLAGSATAAPCLSYDPAVVTLSGTVGRVMAYGPPGFGEDKRHDAKEPFFELRLPQPACTVQGGELDPAEDRITELQLVFMQADRPALHAGQGATVTGKLFHSFTGHHHTTVLLEVGSIR